MTRKMLTAAFAVAALLVSVLSIGAITDNADAQGSAQCPYSLAILGNVCADAIAYPGPFTNMPTTPGGPYGFGSLNPAVGTADGGGDGGTGGGLAHTGSESAALAYVGLGLVAFGAVALGSRRKFFQGALD